MSSIFSDVTNEPAWSEIVEKFPEANFLQSWGWGEFHQQLGETVVRRSYAESEKLAAWSGVVQRAKRGAYLAVAGGPLLNWSDTALVEKVLKDIKEIAKQNHCLFVRFRPQAVDSQELRSLVQRSGAKEAPMHLTADLTLQLDLTLNETELLNQMRKNHRYLIRKAEKEGVITEISTNPDEISEFYQHQLELAKKHGFVPFSFQFLDKQFRTFVSRDQAFLVNAKKGSQLLASAFIIVYNQIAVYHYGVSTEANQNLPGSYAAQWRAIQEAQARGCHKYNFWGIAPKEATNHRFAGVSLFKRGFGGEELNYLPAHDIPLSNRYWLTYFFEQLRKKLRRL